MSRGHPPFEDKWPNWKVARVVDLARDNLSAPAIASELGDGTDPATIRRALDYWGIQRKTGRKDLQIKMSLSARDRTLLHSEALRRETDMGNMAKMIVSGTLRFDLVAGVIGENDVD